MSNKRKGRSQLSLDERIYIETSIARKLTISSIGRHLGRSPSTIEREIKRNGTEQPTRQLSVQSRNICVHRATCRHTDLCRKGCLVPCHRCKNDLCNRLCHDFEAKPCPLLEKPPYCCNGCVERFGFGCSHRYHFYEAAIAHEKAQQRRSESRMGIDCTREELARTVEIAKAGLARGQSICHIWAAHQGEMCCGWRTFYSYVENGVTEGITNLNLPMKVRYRPRKKANESRTIPRDYLEGRTYEDFRNLPDELKLAAVEMDCVEGRLGKDRQVILTLLFRRSNYQIMMLLPEKNSRNVVSAIDSVQALCGDLFGKVFPVILTDRGAEFSDADRIERDRDGNERCRVFYCDANRPDQKPSCENNHREIRKVLPKGRSDFDALTCRDIAVLCSHVNSYAREALGWATPYDLARLMIPEDLVDGLGVERIAADEILLKPALLPHAIISKEPGRAR